MNIDEIYKDMLLTIIGKYLSGCKVYLFGSRANGTCSKGSDIDIALDNGRVLELFVLGNIREKIEESTIPFFVDIVDYHAVSNKMKERILKEGVLWKNH